MNNRYNCVTLMVINLTNFSCLCVYKQSMPYVSWHSSFLQWYLQGSSPREWSDEFSGRTFVIKPKTASVLKDIGYKYRSNRLKPVTILLSLLCTRYDQIMNIFVKLTKYFSIYYECKRSICEICHKINNLYMKIMFCNL